MENDFSFIPLPFGHRRGDVRDAPVYALARPLAPEYETNQDKADDAYEATEAAAPAIYFVVGFSFAHSNSPCLGVDIVFSIRSLAMAKYFSFFSMPINLRFVFRQATPVEPLPMQLSNTSSPSFV